MAKVTYDFLFEMDYAPTHVLKFAIFLWIWANDGLYLHKVVECEDVKHTIANISKCVESKFSHKIAGVNPSTKR